MKNYITPRVTAFNLHSSPCRAQNYLIEFQEDFAATTACGFDQFDTLRINVSASGGTITVSVQPSGVDTGIGILQDPDGVPAIITACDDSGNGVGALDEFSFSPSFVGDYFVFVVNPSPGVGGSYTLTISSTQNNLSLINPNVDDDFCGATSCP